MLKPADIKKAVDSLGVLKAQIASLEEKEEALRQQIIDSGLDAADGDFFHCTVSRSDFTKVDYKAIIDEAKIPPRRLHNLMAAHTEIKERTTVKVTSR
jgi:hypothetical protein